MYSLYAEDVTSEYGPECAFSEISFSKEIEGIMLYYRLVIIKEKTNKGRGYRVIKYVKI